MLQLIEIFWTIWLFSLVNFVNRLKTMLKQNSQNSLYCHSSNLCWNCFPVLQKRAINLFRGTMPTQYRPSVFYPNYITNNIMYPGAQDWIVPNDLQTKFLFKCQAMALILGMPVISNYRNNTIKMGHHQKRAINNCPLLFSNSRVDKANSNGYNHRPITRSAKLGVHRNF